MGIVLPEGSWWDWDVVSWSAGRLCLGAGHDLTYHHELELVFHDTLFMSCPTAFHDPAFRAPTAAELASLAGRLGEAPPLVVAFEADAGGSAPTTCLIAADSVEVVQATVLRYWREDLAPGQRFAPWVRSPNP